MKERQVLGDGLVIGRPDMSIDDNQLNECYNEFARYAQIDMSTPKKEINNNNNKKAGKNKK